MLFRVYVKEYSPQRREFTEIGVFLDQEIFTLRPRAFAVSRMETWGPQFTGSRSPDSIFQPLCAEESHIWCTGAES